MKNLCIILSIILLFSAGCNNKKADEIMPSPVSSPTTEASALPKGASPAPSTDASANTSANEQGQPPDVQPENKPQTQPQNTQKKQDNQPAIQEITEQPKAKTVSLTISIPSQGKKVLNQALVEIESGDTPFTILKKATKNNGIHMSFTGGNANPYVEGIDNLYEFDKGAGSGWLCSVNGTFISKSSGKISVKEGDQILWVYTLDMGKDVGI